MTNEVKVAVFIGILISFAKLSKGFDRHFSSTFPASFARVTRNKPRGWPLAVIEDLGPLDVGMLDELSKTADDLITNSAPVFHPSQDFPPAHALFAIQTLGDLSARKSILSEWLPRGLMLIACALYGTNFGAVKYLEETIPTSTLYLLRFSIASLGAGVPLIFWKDGISPSSVLGAVEIGIYLFLGFVAQGVGLQGTPASASAFIASLSVVFVPFYQYISGTKLSSQTIVSAMIALSGVAVLMLGDVTGFRLSDFVTMLQPVMFGLCCWKMETLLRKYPGGVVPITLVQLLTVAALCGLWCLFEGNFPTPQILETLLSDKKILAGILWMSLVTTTLTFGVETYAMNFLKATEVSLIFTTVPLFGAAFASFFLGETSDWHLWLGGAMITASCLWGTLNEISSAEMKTNENMRRKAAQVIANINNTKWE